MSGSAEAAEIAIRARRAAFNRAIANADPTGIGAFLARDCVMVTGSDSAVIAGRLAQVKVWKREFAAPVRAVYRRTPAGVAVSSAEPLAMETGRWDCGPDGGPHGTYAAKWREVAGEWVIEAEVFVTLG